MVQGESTVNYRKAEQGDILQLVTLRRRQLIDEGATPDDRAGSEWEGYFRAGLSDGSFVCWVAEDGDEIIATGGVCFFRLPPTYANPTGHAAYITNMYTEKTYRRRGIAAELLRRVMEEVRSRGVTLIRLHASKQGRALYEKAGFTDADGFMTLRLKQ